MGTQVSPNAQPILSPHCITHLWQPQKCCAFYVEAILAEIVLISTPVSKWHNDHPFVSHGIQDYKRKSGTDRLNHAVRAAGIQHDMSQLVSELKRELVIRPAFCAQVDDNFSRVLPYI